MSVHDQALAYMRQHGPSLPVKIGKHLNMNMLFASAILSELVDRKLAFFTHATVGNSSMYYLKGQEIKLGPLLYDHLNSREKEAYDLLKQYSILVDKDVGPVVRVALRDLHDFAKQFTVEGEVFWRYHMVTEETAKSLASEYFAQNGAAPVQEPVVEQPVQKDVAVEPPVVEQPVQEEVVVAQVEEVVVKEPVVQSLIPEPVVAQTPVVEQPVVTPTPVQQPLAQQVAPVSSGGALYKKVTDYFFSKNIRVVSSDIVRKNSDLDFVVSLPSALGELSYYVKVKSKTSISDTDVAVAFSEAQSRNLPGILLVSGKLTKKAQAAVARLRGKLTVFSL